MRRFGILLSASLLCAATSLTAQDAPSPELALGARVAARYDSAFAALIETASADTAAYGWLLDLARLKAERIGWAYEQNGQLLAITTRRREAFLVVVPADDPAYARMGSIMETDPGASVRATRVKEDMIAGPWAAIFLAFELSHIRDDVLGLLPETATPEQFAKATRRAYGAEYLAARATGGRPLVQHLDSVLAANVTKSAQELAEGLIPVLRQSFDRFDSLISPQKALTTREEQRRAGVYAAALLLRYAERRPLSDTEFASALQCLGGCR